MKHALILGLLLAASAHVGAHNVGRGSAVGAASSGAQSAGGAQGGRYTLGDEYQPWPQAEMQQYAKPKFEPYRGEQK